MKTAAAPEKAIAERRKVRPSSGLYKKVCVSLKGGGRLWKKNVQIARERGSSPVFDDERKDKQNRDRKQVVVKH